MQRLTLCTGVKRTLDSIVRYPSEFVCVSYVSFGCPSNSSVPVSGNVLDPVHALFKRHSGFCFLTSKVLHGVAQTYEFHITHYFCCRTNSFALQRSGVKILKHDSMFCQPLCNQRLTGCDDVQKTLCTCVQRRGGVVPQLLELFMNGVHGLLCCLLHTPVYA